MTIKNLVFQGGGVKGMAYVGAVGELEKRDVLAGVRNVAGTSAGAITAALLALGATGTVFIDDANIATTDFKITPAQMDALVENGATAAQRWFEAHPLVASAPSEG